jgi:FMN phosphatase YigB (HAD superfamily)
MENTGVSVRGLLFDIGGVLAWDIQEYLFSDETHGIPGLYGLDRQRTWPIATQLWKRYAYERHLEVPDWHQQEHQYWTEFTRELGISTPVEALINLSTYFVRPVEGMQELLESLRQLGVHILICSNNTEFWFQRQRERLGLDQYVAPEDVILSCRVGAPKLSPDFELFKIVKSRLRFDQNDYVFVDNQFENIRHANDFGLTGIYFPTASPFGASYVRRLFQHLGLNVRG